MEKEYGYGVEREPLGQMPPHFQPRQTQRPSLVGERALGPIIPRQESQDLVELTRLKLQLALVRAAALLALEGQARAQVREVLQRAREEEELAEVTPAQAGQLFASLGLRTATSHGRSRLVLEYPRLEACHQALAGSLEQLEPRVQASLRRYRGVAERLQGLEHQLREARSLSQREVSARSQLRQLGEKAHQVATLEQEVARLRQQAARAEKLQAECQELQGKVSGRPDLLERKQVLQQRLKDHEVQARELAQQELALATQVARHQERRALLTLTELQEAITQARAELEQLAQQLGEKRSLVARLFNLAAGGSRQP